MVITTENLNLVFTTTKNIIILLMLLKKVKPSTRALQSTPFQNPGGYSVSLSPVMDAESIGKNTAF